MSEFPDVEDFEDFIKLTLCAKGAEYLDNNKDKMFDRLDKLTQPICDYLNNDESESYAIDYVVLESIKSFLVDAQSKILNIVVQDNKDKVFLSKNSTEQANTVH